MSKFVKYPYKYPGKGLNMQPSTPIPKETTTLAEKIGLLLIPTVPVGAFFVYVICILEDLGIAPWQL